MDENKEKESVEINLDEDIIIKYDEKNKKYILYTNMKHQKFTQILCMMLEAKGLNMNIDYNEQKEEYVYSTNIENELLLSILYSIIENIEDQIFEQKNVA